jgi:uncharacterized membrane protein
MDGDFWMDVVHLIFRWIHVVAGVIWIGHLYFFNWVNGHVAKTYDADSKKKVVPELMPRALYWFRWGAAYTWVSGVLLLGLVYYMNRSLMGADSPDASSGLAIARAFSVVIILPIIYDQLWKTAFKGKEQVGVIVSGVVVIGVAWYLSSFLPGRTAFIHLGAMFGTTMFMNVWMRIWPNQRKIIAAIKEGKGPDADIVALAGLRSKHNTYMSVPLIMMMVSNHFPLVYGFSANGIRLDWAILVVLVVLGWLATKWVYTKSGTDAPKAF